MLAKFGFTSLDYGRDVIRNDKLGRFVTEVTNTCSSQHQTHVRSTLAKFSAYPLMTKVLLDEYWVLTKSDDICGQM